MGSALTAESKDVQWPIPGGDKVRLAATVAAVLDGARPANLTKGDFLVQSAIQRTVIGDILAWDLYRVYTRVGMLLGLHGPDGKLRAPAGGAAPSGTARPTRDVGCPHCGTRFLA